MISQKEFFIGAALISLSGVVPGIKEDDEIVNQAFNLADKIINKLNKEDNDRIAKILESSKNPNES